MRRRTFAAGMLATALLGGAGAVEAAPTVLKVGYVAAQGSLIDATATEFARRVNADLAGKVEIQLYSDSKLGTDEEMLKGIKTGNPDMSVASSIMSTLEPKFGVFELPYLVSDRRHLGRIATNRGVQELISGGLPSKGVRSLALWENGFRHVTNNVRPIYKPEDLKGLKLRVPPGVWRLRMFQAYGATPTPLAFGKVYDALASGEMDGQENPLTQIVSAKFHEVQKYLSLSGHVYTPSVLLIGEDAWQRLSPDVQRTLARLAAEAGDWARREGARLDKDLVAKLPPTIKVNEVNKEVFFRASAPVYEQFASEVPGGAVLIKTIQNLR